MARYTVTVSADHFQFLIEDQDRIPDDYEVWTHRARSDRLDVANGMIAVGLPRYGGAIPIVIDVQHTRPTAPLDRWEHVVEASIEVNSGRLVIHGPEDYSPEEEYLSIPPGTYRVLVCFAGLETIRDPDDMEGEDHYHIVIWPGSAIEPVVHKRSTSPNPLVN